MVSDRIERTHRMPPALDNLLEHLADELGGSKNTVANLCIKRYGSKLLEDMENNSELPD